MYGCATPWSVALKLPIFKLKKGSRTLVRPKLLLHGSSRPPSRDTVIFDKVKVQFRIRILQKVSGPRVTDPDPAKSFGSLRIRIHNTGYDANIISVTSLPTGTCLHRMLLYLASDKIVNKPNYRQLV
jgi:hypothetical protein